MEHDCRKCSHPCSLRVEPEPQPQPLGIKIASRIIALVFFIPIMVYRILVIMQMRKRAIIGRNQLVERIEQVMKARTKKTDELPSPEYVA